MARYSVNNYTVETLLSNIKSGNIAIPEMQRPFVWDSSKVRDLVDSLYKGFPVGYIIVWQNPDVKLKDGTKSSGKKVLIDGQQRITAMAAAIVGQEVLDDHYKWKRISIDYDSKSVSWDREKLPLVLMKMLQEADVEVLVGTQFVNAIMEENTIRGVIFCDKNGRHAAYGKSIVDTSGIAEVAYQAGADCTVLKERQTGGMSLGMDNVDMDKLLAFAQEKKAIRLLSYKMKGKVKEHIARLTLDLRKLQEFQEVVAPMVLLEDGSDKDESVEYKSKIEQFHFMDSPCMIANKKNSFNMINAVTANFDTTDPEECQRMRIELTRSCFKLAQELRTHVPGFENAQLDWVSPDIGIRFGRLVGCEYDITVEDVNELVIPTDVVGVYGVQDAYLAAGKNYRIEGGWYGIPYRALVPRRVENLLVAGEMITSDWIVWMSIRLSGGCMLMGQAAGTAAALAARQGISPRELDYAQLREALLKDGAFLG